MSFDTTGGNHRIAINTKEGIFTLDGISLMDCATGCSVRYIGGTLAEVSISMMAEVELQDLLEVRVQKDQAQEQISM